MPKLSIINVIRPSTFCLPVCLVSKFFTVHPVLKNPSKSVSTLWGDDWADRAGMTCVWIGLAGIVLYNRRRLIGSTIRSCQVQNSLFQVEKRKTSQKILLKNWRPESLMFDLWRPGSQLMLILIDTHGHLWYIALKGILTSLLHYWLDDTSATVKR